MNNVTLLGRLTDKPELDTTPNGTQYTRFTVAVDRYTKKGEEKKADFIDCVAWNGTAQFISNYFWKGQWIGIVGSIQTGTYEKDGQKRKSFSVNVREANFAGGSQNNMKQEAEADAEDKSQDWWM